MSDDLKSPISDNDKLRLAADNLAKQPAPGDPQFADDYSDLITCPKCKNHTYASDPCCGDSRDYNEMLRDAADLGRDE